MADKYRFNSKQEIDGLIDRIKKSDWKATDFLYRNCWDYCRIIYYRRDWHINEEDLDSIINYSIGKTIAKYEICGRYWGLLSIIFNNEVHDYFRSVYKEKELGTRVDNKNIHQEKTDFDLTKTEISMQLEQALAMKPKDQKQCIQLMLEGYSDAQIKERLNTKKSIKDLKYHAKVNLKKVLVNKFGFGKKSK